MAKAAAKKQAKAQAAAKSTYQPLIAAVVLWYAAIRLYYKQGERIHYYALTGCLLIYKITLPMAIEASVAPEGSITGYFFDVMVLTLFTQTLSTYTDKAWYILLIVPAFGVFKAGSAWFGKLSASASASAEPEDEAPAGPKKERKPKRKTMKSR